jgi:hypothetical protein
MVYRGIQSHFMVLNGISGGIPWAESGRNRPATAADEAGQACG